MAGNHGHVGRLIEKGGFVFVQWGGGCARACNFREYSHIAENVEGKTTQEKVCNRWAFCNLALARQGKMAHYGSY